MTPKQTCLRALLLAVLAAAAPLHAQKKEPPSLAQLTASLPKHVTLAEVVRLAGSTQAQPPAIDLSRVDPGALRTVLTGPQLQQVFAPYDGPAPLAPSRTTAAVALSGDAPVFRDQARLHGYHVEETVGGVWRFAAQPVPVSRTGQPFGGVSVYLERALGPGMYLIELFMRAEQPMTLEVRESRGGASAPLSTIAVPAAAESWGADCMENACQVVAIPVVTERPWTVVHLTARPRGPTGGWQLHQVGVHKIR